MSSPEFVNRESAILHRLGPAVRRALLIAAALLVMGFPPAPAQAHTLATAPAAITSSVAEPCPGDPIRTDQLTTGSFDASLQGSYVNVPFPVPAGTTAVRVKYCFASPRSRLPTCATRWTSGSTTRAGFAAGAAPATRT